MGVRMKPNLEALAQPVLALMFVCWETGYEDADGSVGVAISQALTELRRLGVEIVESREEFESNLDALLSSK